MPRPLFANWKNAFSLLPNASAIDLVAPDNLPPPWFICLPKSLSKPVVPSNALPNVLDPDPPPDDGVLPVNPPRLLRF